jgi:hypothetical protein
VKGTGFSPYVITFITSRALAPEVSLFGILPRSLDFFRSFFSHSATYRYARKAARHDAARQKRAGKDTLPGAVSPGHETRAPSRRSWDCGIAGWNKTLWITPVLPFVNVQLGF